MRWLVRYFRLRHEVREFARRLMEAPERLDAATPVSTWQLALVGRVLEEMVDEDDGRWSECSRGA